MTNLVLDIAHLTVLDPNHYEAEKAQDEQFLLEQATNSFNNLFSQIQSLPLNINNKNRHDLPKPVISIPREYPIPLEKPLTRFEQFKKAKGLKFKEKETKEFDEVTGEWHVKADRAHKITDKEWLIEVPNGVYEDPFEKRDAARKEAVAEQKKRERRNKLRAARQQIDYHRAVSVNSGISPKQSHTVENLKSAIKTSSHPGSSASMNQFNKVKNKPTIFEEGSKLPKIIDRNVGKNKKGKK